MKALLKNLRDGERERMMYCQKCGAENSADRADYFLLTDPQARFTCCRRGMEIVTKQVNHIAVR